MLYSSIGYFLQPSSTQRGGGGGGGAVWTHGFRSDSPNLSCLGDVVIKPSHDELHGRHFENAFCRMSQILRINHFCIWLFEKYLICVSQCFPINHINIDDGDDKMSFVLVSIMLLSGILYNWYILQAFNFRYSFPPYDSSKITSFK